MIMIQYKDLNQQQIVSNQVPYFLNALLTLNY